MSVQLVDHNGHCEAIEAGHIEEGDYTMAEVLDPMFELHLSESHAHFAALHMNQDGVIR